MRTMFIGLIWLHAAALATSGAAAQGSPRLHPAVYHQDEVCGPHCREQRRDEARQREQWRRERERRLYERWEQRHNRW